MAEAAAQARGMTAEEFAALPDNGMRRELVRGEVREMPPAGFEHGWRGQSLAARLTVWVEDHDLGRTVLAETGFVLQREPDTVRAPDAAFVVKDRLREGAGFSEVVPDLVLEVVSPSESPRDVLSKVGDWLASGVRVVWLVWPKRRVLQVWRAADDVTLLHADDTLTCEDLLPGFALPLSRVLGD